MSRKKLIVFIVVVGLIGYIGCALLSYFEVFDILNGEKEKQNIALLYITNALTGLVGGIVAAGFGVVFEPSQGEAFRSISQTKPSRRQQKFRAMGNMAAPQFKDDLKKENLGGLYAWAYMIVGVAGVGLWIYLESSYLNVPQSIANQATVFAGMFVAIITMYFSNNNS